MNTTDRQIQNQLTRIEDAHEVRVLFAAESGSRAWGFASRDSGFDVRFLYVHACDWYLAVDPGRDVIDETIDGALDFAGWDLREALILLRSSNPSLLEWIKSPVVYRADPAFALLFGLLAAEYHAPDRLFCHYFDVARSHHHANRQPGRVRLKNYLYVLRPLLACRWVERGLGPVPMKFATLVDRVVADANLRFHIAVLVARTRAGEELDLALRVPLIDSFLTDELARLEKIVPVPTVVPGAEKLNQFFREFCTAEAA